MAFDIAGGAAVGIGATISPTEPVVARTTSPAWPFEAAKVSDNATAAITVRWTGFMMHPHRLSTVTLRLACQHFHQTNRPTN
jgi:hypothetical protein